MSMIAGLGVNMDIRVSLHTEQSGTEKISSDVIINGKGRWQVGFLWSGLIFERNHQEL